jgi:hypothetical protein
VIAWRKHLESRELAPSSIGRKLSALSALFDYLCERNAVAGNPVDGVKRPTGDGPEFRRLAQPGEGRKLPDIAFISPPGFGIGDVGEPFELGRRIGEITELGRRECAPFDCNQVLGHHRTSCPPVFDRPLSLLKIPFEVD